jgi:hypothetical protein
MEFRIFWDVLPCSQVDADQHFRGIYLTTQQYIPEHSKLRTRHCENLKPHIVYMGFIIYNNRWYVVHTAYKYGQFWECKIHNYHLADKVRLARLCYNSSSNSCLKIKLYQQCIVMYLTILYFSTLNSTHFSNKKKCI